MKKTTAIMTMVFGGLVVYFFGKEWSLQSSTGLILVFIGLNNFHEV